MPDIIYINARYGFREDTLENWQTENPVLEKGEPSIVRDPTEPSEWLKFGDGETAWNDLPYRKGPQGEKGDKGDKGADGDDYVLTDADKTDIANLVIETLPTFVWEGVY